MKLNIFDDGEGDGEKAIRGIAIFLMIRILSSLSTLSLETMRAILDHCAFPIPRAEKQIQLYDYSCMMWQRRIQQVPAHDFPTS